MFQIPHKYFKKSWIVVYKETYNMCQCIIQAIIEQSSLLKRGGPKIIFSIDVASQKLLKTEKK